MNAAHKILTSGAAALLCAGLAVAASSSNKEARVTQIIHDVKLLPSDAAVRAAVVNDRVAEDTGVRTGGDSRSELTFSDLTITRLGANTIFSFNKAGRNDKIESGSILLRVPKDSGGGTIRTSAVTVAVTGTTVILESIRKNRLFVLEGSARLSLVKYPKQFQNVRGGQMVDVPPGATTVPLPTNFDLNDLMKTHPLITDFGPLPSRDLITAAAQQQNPTTSTGPNFPIVPIISIFGGPPRRQPPNRNPPQPPPRPNRNPPGTRPVVGPTTNQNNPAPTPTPPPILTRRGPNQTTTKAPVTTTTTRAQTTYQPNPSPTPRKRVIKKPTTQTSGPR
jgi:hypothetical protein